MKPAEIKCPGYIILELWQNALRHGDHLEGVIPKLSIKKYAKGLTVTISNPLRNKKVTKLKAILDYLASCSAEELNILYLSRLRDGKLTEEKAGLGLIDIFRKAGNVISFKFVAASLNYSFFTISVTL